MTFTVLKFIVLRWGIIGNGVGDRTQFFLLQNRPLLLLVLLCLVVHNMQLMKHSYEMFISIRSGLHIQVYTCSQFQYFAWNEYTSFIVLDKYKNHCSKALVYNTANLFII